jgi:serine/threonine-protein kinase
MHYLAWPFVEGQSLDKIVQAEGKLSAALAAHYALQVAEGLDICHQQALFHGLLKPSNLMVGANRQIHILDFGIGCLLAETEGESLVDTMSTANSVASGLDCASPESIMDPTNLTPSGDQYSLGCVLYYCLTGQYPFPDGSSAEKMMAHQFKEPTPVRELNPDVSQELADIVQRLMQKAPEQRYGGAGEVVDALRPLAEPVGDMPRATLPGPRPLGNRPPSSVARTGSHYPGAAQRPGPLGPSAQTPKPANLMPLPSRQSVHGTPPKPHLQDLPDDLPIEVEVVEDVEEVTEKRSWDEKLGSAGIIAIGVLVCAIAFIVVRFVL